MEYGKTIGHLDGSAIKSEHASQIHDSASDGRSWSSIQISECRMEGDRLDLITQRWSSVDSNSGKKNMKLILNKRIIWNGEMWYEHHLKSKEMDFPGRIIRSKKEVNKKETLSIGFTGAPLNGIMRGDIKPLTSIVKDAESAQLRNQKESINGSLCHVIDIVSKDGLYTIWIDPKHGHNIAQAKARKKVGNILFGKPVSAKSNIPDQYNCTEFNFTLSNVVFEMIDGNWMPVEADFHREEKFKDGRKVEIKSHHKRTAIDLAPDFKSLRAFVLNIPNGTPAANLDFSGIRYQWLNGEFVPVVPSDAIESIEASLSEVMVVRNKEGFEKIDGIGSSKAKNEINIDSLRAIDDIDDDKKMVVNKSTNKTTRIKGWKQQGLILLIILGTLLGLVLAIKTVLFHVKDRKNGRR